MGSSIRPERPSLDEIVKRANRPSIDAIAQRAPDRVQAAKVKAREGASADEAAAATEPSYAEQVNRRLLALTDFVPGAHALIAGGRAALDPNRDYADEVGGIRESLDAYNADDGERWRRRALKGAGALAVGGAAGRVATSAAGQGALLSGAGAAGVADPEMSLGERALGTGMAMGTGAVLGKGLEVGGTAAEGLLQFRPNATGLRSALPQMREKPVEALLRMNRDRAVSAQQLYGRAMAEGDANAIGAATKQVDDFLGEPEIAAIVDDLRSVREFRDLPPNHPKILDQVVKELSDRSGMLKKGTLAPNPSRPNSGRVRANEVQSLKAQGLDAISDPVTGPMPTYITAHRDFAVRSRLMEAYRKGYEALRSEGTVGLPAVGGLEKRSAEVVDRWLAKEVRNLSETEAAQLRQAVADGTRGATREAMRRMSLIRPLWSLAGVNALAEAPAVMRAAGVPKSTTRGLFDMLNASATGASGTPIGGLLENRVRNR